MPDFTFTSPEGKKYTVAGPAGATREQAFVVLQARIRNDVAETSAPTQPAPVAAPAAPAPPKPAAWGDVPLQALKNVPASAGRFVGGIVDAVRHPANTANNVLDLLEAGVEKITPDAIKRLERPQTMHNEAAAQAFGWGGPAEAKAHTEQATAKADALGQFYKDRYGSGQGLRDTLANDPVGALSDASALLTGGGSAIAKLPMLGKAGGVVKAAGNLANPVVIAGKAAGKILPVVGQGAAELVGRLGTHTGAQSLSEAFNAGRRGGAPATALADNMRGNVPMTDVLDAAKANLQAMGRAKSAEYRSGMAAVSADKSVLDFKGIDQAVKEADKIGKYQGEVINTKAGQVHQAIADAAAEWKALPPDQFHTPEGLDALKQKIGGIVDSVPFEEKTARLAGNNIYHAVKAEIVRQAPTYADTMKQYSEATEHIREIERALSLNKKASVDTAMRKLQSITRNNAQTNYGYRLGLARDLEAAGGNELMPALAGQALSSWTPRGLGGAMGAGLGLGTYAMGGPGLALPALALQSPRLMGETALALGKGTRGVKTVADLPKRALARIGIDPATMTNTLSVLGRQP